IARDKSHAYLMVSPLVNDNGNFKKITSFTISYSNSRNGLRTNNARRVITNSVLNSGNWYRFSVNNTGVHRITRSFLEQLGINLNGVDPRAIKLYGNGGNMIPYENAANFPFDVEENAIRIIGETDGVFHSNDYILFYAQGPMGYDATRNTNLN